MNKIGKPAYYLIIQSLLWVVIINVFSCNSNRIDPGILEQDYRYFPLETGNFREYEIIDIQYSISEGKDSLFYYLKEVIEESFTNQRGELTYVIRRYKRFSDTASWNTEPTESWLAVRSKTNLVLYENSIPLVKLIFPAENESVWDGNAFNIADPEFYSYHNVAMPFDLGESTWDRTLEVIQGDLVSLVSRDSRYEIYASGIGLIYKESIVLDYVNDTSSPDYGKNVITFGKEYIQTLTDYGKE